MQLNRHDAASLGYHLEQVISYYKAEARRMQRQIMVFDDYGECMVSWRQAAYDYERDAEEAAVLRDKVRLLWHGLLEKS